MIASVNKTEKELKSWKQQGSENESAVAGKWTAMGLCFGVAFGSAFGNVGLGICLGMAIGVALDTQAGKGT
jgi:hypothetical protein